MSAPEKPEVPRASTWMLTSSASGIFLVWTARMPSRPFTSGRFTTMRRSKRPGRSSAGSRTSGRFVAATMMTPSFDSKPSISTRSWFSVCSRSSCPPPRPAPRWRPTASISSMNRMQGALRLPCSNRSRTRLAPTPTNISTKSEPDMLKNGTPASPATAFASSVLPEPGGPRSSAPFGILPPRRWNFCGSFRNSMISCSSCFASSQPATSLNVTRVCDSMSTRALLFPKRIAAEPPLCICRSVNIHATRNSSSGSHVNNIDSQLIPGACTVICAVGFAVRALSASAAPSPRKFVLNALSVTDLPPTVSVVSVRSSPSTVRVSSTNVARSMLPFSTSCTNRVYGMSIRCAVSRFPAYMRYAMIASSRTRAQKPMVRNGRPGGVGSCGPRPPRSPREPRSRFSSSPSLWNVFTPLLLQNAHVGQVSVPLSRVHAVTDHEFVPDRPSLVVHRYGDLPARGLVEQRCHLDARRATGFEEVEDEFHAPARIHDTLAQHEVPAADVAPQVHDQLHVAARHRAGAIGRHRKEVHLEVDRRGAGEIRLEHAGALQDPDEQRVLPGKVPSQLEPHLAHALLDLAGREQHSDRGLRVDGGAGVRHGRSCLIAGSGRRAVVGRRPSSPAERRIPCGGRTSVALVARAQSSIGAHGAPGGGPRGAPGHGGGSRAGRGAGRGLEPQPPALDERPPALGQRHLRPAARCGEALR